MKTRGLVTTCAVLWAGILLAACGGGTTTETQATKPPLPTAPPTLDLDQIPVLGDDPVPPVPLAATDPRFPIEPASGAALSTGRQLYGQFCASCHGSDGEGEQPDPLAPGASPPHNADGHTWHHPDQQNFLTVWQGRNIAGVMPAYYERLSPDEIISILAYIKTWWRPDQLERQMAQTRLAAEP